MPIATAPPCTLSDVADVADDVENVRQAAWMNETPAVLVNIQRQPGANVIEVADRIKKLLPQLQSALPSSVQVTRTDRPDDVHPRLCPGRAVRTDARSRARHHGDFSLPPHAVSHRHSRGGRPLVAHRHVRRDVPHGIQPEQSDADGAHDFHGIRGRRCDRHDRKHFHGISSAAIRRCKPRSRDPSKSRSPSCRLSISLIAVLIPLAVHGRRRRTAVPGVRGHAEHDHRDFGHRLPHPDADDVRTPAALPPQTRSKARFTAGPKTSLIGPSPAMAGRCDGC